MTETKQHFLMGLCAGVFATLFAFLLVILISVYAGSYNVAASEDHSSFGRWVFSTTMHASVKRQAPAADKVPSLTEAMVAAGAKEYQAMCEHCHGAPGINRREWAEGILPQPPHLAEAAAEWTPAEVFWLVKHGVKMTAMPAFGPTHNDEALWNITAFVKQLPAMTKPQYEHLAGSEAHEH